MNGEVKFLINFEKNISFFGGFGRGWGWGVRVDVNGEVKFLIHFEKNISFLGGFGRGWGVGGQGRCER